ncbi:hypothetical protein D3C73_1525640 [compost metagenome]
MDPGDRCNGITFRIKLDSTDAITAYSREQIERLFGRDLEASLNTAAYLFTIGKEIVEKVIHHRAPKFILLER